MAENGAYVGVWTNWSKGRVLGVTLTLEEKYGAPLIAVLALCVSWSGHRLWNIICFTSHYVRSTQNRQDLVHHAHQVLLCAGYGSIGFLSCIVQISWSWRSESKRSLSKTIIRGLPLACLAHGCSICIAVVSTLSTRVTSANDDALAMTTACGWPNESVLNWTALSQQELDRAEVLYVVGNYAYEHCRIYTQTCYRADMGTDNRLFNGLARPFLASSVNLNDTCPFEGDICETNAVTLDTSYLDSSKDFGINAPPKDRIQFRKIASCAVIEADTFSSDWVSEDTPPLLPTDPITSVPGVGYKYYYLGTLTFAGVVRPFTFFLSNYSSGMEKSYSTLTYASNMVESTVNFEPISQLNRGDADVFLLVLHNKATYTEPVLDPWFNSTSSDQLNGAQVWRSSRVASILGCTEQYQFCGHGNCTNLGPISDLNPEALSGLELNPNQRATIDVLWQSAVFSKLHYLSFTLQDNILMAKDHLFGVWEMSTGLPDHQWEMEVQNLFNLSLATLQYLVYAHAAPSDIPITANTTYFQHIVKENTSEALHICKNQRIRTTTYYSFDVAGLLIILGGGSFIVMLSYLVPTVVSRWLLVRAGGSAKYPRKEYISQDVIQLLCIALERSGIGPWVKKDDVLVPKDLSQKFTLPWLV